MLNPRFWTLTGIVFASVIMRLMPHPPNFTPIAATALFGGAYFASKKAAFMVPLVAMYLSDLFLGFFVYDFGWFNKQMPFVYGSFAVTVSLGMLIRHRCSRLRIGCAALAGSIVFFLVSNFGVWAGGTLYPKTVDGLVMCYVAAIPFFRNTLAGDFAFTALLFGGFTLAERCVPVLRVKQQLLPVRG
jgi:hypothetical protein